MKMTPMGDQLLVTADSKQGKTKSGIILSNSEGEYGYAKVIDVGPGIFTQTGDRIEMACKTGDTVLVPNRLLSGKNGNEVTLEDTKYLLVRESEIVMKSI
tara:strand:- start:1203 stop:1502 length:300 start_codon:yes stop_codon:yes gene_type:complete